MSDCPLVNAPSCKCNDDYSLTLGLTDAKESTSTEPDIIKLHFDEVHIGYERSKQLVYANESQTTLDYHVKHKPTTVCLYQCFTISMRQFTLRPGETTKIRIVYKPLIMWHIDHDFITLVDSNGAETRVELTGKSIGPQVQISSSALRFNTWPQRPVEQLSVEIRNLSTIAVAFSLDVDCTPDSATASIFSVEPRCGIVEGLRYTHLKVSFRPPTLGEYSRRFFCLLQNHPPLVIDCIGVYWKSQELQDSIRFIMPSIITTSLYDCYLRDVQSEPLQFKDVYLDFGSVDLTSQTESSLITSFTNNLDHPIVIKAYPDDFFHVSPTEIEVPAAQIVLYYCTFRPPFRDRLYSRHLLFNAFPPERAADEANAAPFTIILRALGHSFSGIKRWLPLFEVHPTTVIIPPLLPGEPGFATIELKSVGFLPTSFKFIKPTTSNFLIKPMMGTVQGRIFAVVKTVNIKSDKQKVFAEQWHINLNHTTTHNIPICLKVYVEYPSIEVGENNMIAITGVQIGCEEVITVPIRNTSQHHVHFEFLIAELPVEVTILNPKGDIPANASTTMMVSFKSPTRVCKEFVITSWVYAMKELKQIYGSPVEHVVTMSVEADSSQLCCIPKSHDFGIVEHGGNYATTICIHNYGRTTIHYKLSICRHNNLMPYLNATISPVFGSLEPTAHVHCEIMIRMLETKTQKARVCYEIRPNPNTMQTIEDTRQFLFEFTANVLYPYFQIVEIAEHNFGPLFSKRSLWEFLNLNWLNSVLTTTQPNDKAMCINLNLPDAEISEKHFYIILIVQNVTPFSVEVTLKRRKLCECVLQDIGTSFTKRQRTFQCPHRQMCTLSLPKMISPLAVQTITLQAQYICTGETMLSYNLSMNQNRTILLNFRMFGIGVDYIQLSKYNACFSLLFPSVCMRLKQPSVYVFWFYNNSNTPVSYEVSAAVFDKINQNFHFKVWKCLNPIGVVNEYEACPLFIKYHPLEKKFVVLKVPLLVSNGQTIELHIRARGSRNSRLKNVHKLYLPQLMSPGGAVHLSMDRLQIRTFPVWSSATRMFFMTNVSDDILGYNWIKTEVPGLCSVEVMNPNRVLRPNQTDTLVLQVKSFDKACATRVHLSCQLISHNKYLQHQKSVQDYQRREIQIQNELIITEEGTSYPKNEEVILPEATCFYLTIALELEITSFIDRDSHYTPDEQFKLEVQKTYSTNVDFCSVIQKLNEPPSVDVENPIHPLPSDASSSTNNDDLYVEKDPHEIDPAVDNVTFYGHVVEALLADAIFAKNFHEVLNIKKRSAPIYYTQIRSQECGASTLQQTTKNIFKTPQMPFVKDVMHSMLLKSFDEIFYLKTKEHGKPINYMEEVDLPNICKYIQPIGEDVS